MKNKTLRKPDIVDELHTLHAERQEVIRARLEEFSRVP